jgi:hypothetical protein
MNAKGCVYFNRKRLVARGGMKFGEKKGGAICQKVREALI